MTPSEATTLARLARAVCPQQHFDEYTPDAWFDLLGDLDFEDCRQGLVAAAKAKPFVSPAEIRAEVRTIRHERLVNADLAVPPADPDARDYTAQLRAQIAAMADGKTVGPALPEGAERSPRTPCRDAAQLLDDARRRCVSASAQRRGRPTSTEGGDDRDADND